MPQLHVRADRCAHTRLTTSRCDACVQACPTQAWTLQDDGLSLDTNRCDGCGLCVVACPLEALETDAPALLLSARAPRTLWLACERTDGVDVAHKGRVTCLHGLPVHWLLQQARSHGITRITCASGDCCGCPRQPVAALRLQARWQSWTQRHPDDALPPLTHLPPARWCQHTQDLSAPDPSRRRFLSGRVAPPGPATKHGTGPDRGLGSGALSEVAPVRGVRPLAQWQLDWDLQRCTWCMVCVHLCPTQALDTTPDDTQEHRQSLSVQTDACSGCGLCVDGCDLAVLSLHALANPSRGRPRTFPLQRTSCTRCRVDFWRLVSAGGQYPPGDATVCPTCARGKPRWEQRVIQRQD